MKSPAIIITVTALLVTAALFAAFGGADRSFFVPAQLGSAHSRFTEGCLACHVPWRGATQQLCLDCHSRSMATDTHPASRLASPVTAKVPPELSRMTCVDCHREHRPSSAGYTGPAVLCRKCHPAQTLKGAHRDFAEGSCRTAACHSYHSNIKSSQYSAAYRHRIKPASLAVQKPVEPQRKALAPEEAAKMKASRFYKNNPVVSTRYEIGAHFGTQATCARCHDDEGRGSALTPGVKICADCHEQQVKTFVTGRHGAPDVVEGGALARQSKKMGCGACHDAHSLRLENAVKDACLKCHTDTHAQNYEKSGHNRYLTDPVFEGKPMTGVDCAGCHMPRKAELGGYTDHNETLSSSTREAMASAICSNCHGLRFALMALYDNETVRSNFTAAPSKIPRGIEYLDALIAGGG